MWNRLKGSASYGHLLHLSGRADAFWALISVYGYQADKSKVSLEEDMPIMSYRLQNPGHPGGYVLRNVIEPRDLTVMDAASLLDVPRQALFDFLNEKVPLTAELAFRIETVFGIEMETLMDMQTQFDIAEARKQFQPLRTELAAKARAPMPGSAQQPADIPMRTVVRRSSALA
ncbi:MULTISPECIES: HigA family addiction module antitoxin [unclassified Methylobacterium]|uniref:HigA family addiction module antitoxin n=1 Tax=unclassified Methylobacterium TaxID=2615210 RepID=UPI001FEFA7AB|nr:HigA family addiction module antitoxin [Methylobacterium sp. 2A]